VTKIYRRCSSRYALLIVLLLSCCARGSGEFTIGGFRYDSAHFEQWKLPGSLREISGLAETPDGRLFAHSDEHAVVHQIDYRNGGLLGSFSLGHHPSATAQGKAIKGDFEGIAVVDETVYLITSKGTLYAAPIGADGSTVGFEAYKTGLKDICEIEGLAYHSNLGALLLACKVVHSAELRGKIVVFQWSIEHRATAFAPIIVPTSAVAARLGSPDFNPSAITVSPRNGNLLLAAARQRALLEITMSGTIVNMFTLPMESYHRQTEGLALFADGTLILADEGGKKRGRLGVYRAID